MKLKSLTLYKNKIIPIEVEVSLLPGLPQIHFLGLADRGLKESAIRIKAAVRAEGFRWPKAHQIVVNLSPSDIPKTSVGVELAVTLGILIETKQINPDILSVGQYCFGELGLDGQVTEPKEISFYLPSDENSKLLTGFAQSKHMFSRQVIERLSDLSSGNIQYIGAADRQGSLQRPDLYQGVRFSQRELRLMKILAVGEFNILLAGSSGGGKTTFAKSIPSFLSAPTDEDQRKGYIQNRWRPWIDPHHSISYISMIGGGSPPRPGEITRAHRGVLFLDEMLEFKTEVLEALREPTQSGVIRVSKGMQSEVFPAQFMLVGATNLCPCGDWLPGKESQCGFSRVRCFSVRNRMSIPFLDRFQVFAGFDFEKQRESIDLEKNLQEINEARDVIQFIDPEIQIPSEYIQKIETYSISERRKKALLQVVRVIMALEQRQEPRMRDWAEAWFLSVEPFIRLKAFH